MKGVRVVLEERGTNTAGKNPEWMHKKLASHHNIKHEMNLIEHLLRQKGYICVFLPKFHPEINPMRGYGLNLRGSQKGIAIHTTITAEETTGIWYGYSGRYPEALSQGPSLYVCIFGGTKAWS